MNHSVAFSLSRLLLGTPVALIPQLFADTAPPAMPSDTALRCIERAIITKLLNAAGDAGWMLQCITDGADAHQFPSQQEVLDIALASGESTVYFTKRLPGFESPNYYPTRCWVYISTGGSGHDCLADYSADQAFEREVMAPANAFAAHFE